MNVNEDTGEVVGTRAKDRNKMFDQIADSSEKLRAEQEEFEIDYTEDEPETDDKVSDDSLDNHTEEVQNKHKIKVNGREMELSYEELVARAQKVEAADQYLAEAARMAKQAKPEPEVMQDSFEDELAIVRAIQMGDEKEALDALRQLKKSLSSKDETVKLINDQLAGQRAAEWFRNEYQDIVSDPYLFKLAMSQDAEMVQSGDTRDYLERWGEIGEKLREWRGKPKDSFDQKAEKKKDIVSLSPASRKSAAPVEDDAEESPADIIRAMAKKRGQV